VLAPQAFVTMNFVKALISLVMSNFVNGWFKSSGAKSVFTTVAIMNLAVSSGAIPMYFYGKRLRSIVSFPLPSFTIPKQIAMLIYYFR